MKRFAIPLLALLFVAFPGRWAADYGFQIFVHRKVCELNDVERQMELENLERQLTPPQGIRLSEVEQVYGKSHECETEGGKTAPDVNCRLISVISNPLNRDSGAGLKIRLRGQNVRSAGFFYSGQIHGLKQIALGFKQYLSDKDDKMQMQSQREAISQQGVFRNNEIIALTNLKTIQHFYARRLARASWRANSL